MRIHVNGELREVEENLSIPELITLLNLKAEQIAIELNQRVIRRVEWPATILRDADKVEIVHFVGGGGERKSAGSRSRGGVRSGRQSRPGGI